MPHKECFTAAFFLFLAYVFVINLSWTARGFGRRIWLYIGLIIGLKVDLNMV